MEHEREMSRIFLGLFWIFRCCLQKGGKPMSFYRETGIHTCTFRTISCIFIENARWRGELPPNPTFLIQNESAEHLFMIMQHFQ